MQPRGKLLGQMVGQTKFGRLVNWPVKYQTIWSNVWDTIWSSCSFLGCNTCIAHFPDDPQWSHYFQKCMYVKYVKLGFVFHSFQAWSITSCGDHLTIFVILTHFEKLWTLFQRGSKIMINIIVSKFFEVRENDLKSKNMYIFLKILRNFVSGKIRREFLLTKFMIICSPVTSL